MYKPRDDKRPDRAETELLELERTPEGGENCGVLRVNTVRVREPDSKRQEKKDICWCFQIIFNSVGQRNHCRNVSPSNRGTKGFQIKGTKRKDCPHMAEPKLQL